MHKFLVSLCVTALGCIAVFLSNSGKATVIKAWEFELQQDDIPSGRQFRYAGDDFECGGGYVYSIQSRLFTNSNDLEFWCRPTEVDLKFEPLPKANTGIYRTGIANIGGELYDFDTSSVFDFRFHRWSSKTFGPYSPIVVQPKPSAIFAFSYEHGTCSGVSLHRGADYLGTLASVGYSAVAVWDDKFYVNDGAKTFAATVPDEPTDSCRILDATIFDDASKYAYGIFQAEDRSLLIGGTQGGYGKASFSCVPPFERFANGSAADITSSLLIPDCPSGTVKEYYSFAPSTNGVLIGNFPVGSLLSYRNGALSLTDVAAPETGDFVDHLGTYYRESQAVVNAYGATFVGMYPWGEVIVSREKGSETHRLFNKPVRDASPTPYFWPAHKRALKIEGVAFDPRAELVYSLTKDGSSLRSEGREPTLWGQRVASIAVLSGRVCASTGNLDGAAFKPEIHADLTKDEAFQYGRVHCAKLPGHAMTSMPIGRRARFVVTQTSIKIKVDGKVMAKTRHGLSAHQLSSLK